MDINTDFVMESFAIRKEIEEMPIEEASRLVAVLKER